jgi:hypothetical protein
MGLLKSANSTAIPWVDVQKPNFATGQSTDSYQPVMALASNHIHFLGLPGLPAGDAKIFVIHCTLLFFFCDKTGGADDGMGSLVLAT